MSNLFCWSLSAVLVWDIFLGTPGFFLSLRLFVCGLNTKKKAQHEIPLQNV